MTSKVFTDRNDIIALPRHSHDSTGVNTNTERRLNDILAKLEIENKIKQGAENLLQVFEAKRNKDDNIVLRKQVESQLDGANAKIQLLNQQLDDLDHTRTPQPNHIDEPTNRSFHRSKRSNSSSREASPTWVLGDILQSFGDPKQESETIVERCNELVSLLQKYPLMRYDLVGSQVGDKIRILLLNRKTEVVAAGYRVARNILTDVDSVKKLKNVNIDLFIIRSLARDSKYQLERLQALSLVRSLFDISRGIDIVSQGVVRAIVATAEQSDDRLRNIALETLAELLVMNPQIVWKSGGIRVLLQSTIEGPFELSYPTVMAFAYILDKPEHCKVLRNGRDLECLVSVFTEIQTRDHINTEKLQTCAKCIAYLLRTWPGLKAFSMNQFYSLRILLECLYISNASLRSILLDLLFSVFNIKPLSWSSSFLAGRRLTTLGRIPDKERSFEEKEEPKNTESRYLDHYNGLLILIFMRCGMVDCLVKVLENGDSLSTRKATLLISEVVQISSKIIPLGQVDKLAVLSDLVKKAVSHRTKEDSAASAAIFQIEKVSRNLQKDRKTSQESHNSDSFNYSSMSQHFRTKMGVQMDDASFKQLMLDTQVLHTKTYTKWNWDALSELIQGPLLNPKRLDEAVKMTKFMKRLLSFYRPFKYRFSAIKRTKPNQKYITVGCELLTTLLANQEGVRYLTENKLLRQIAECLAQLDPMSGIISSDPLFSSQRLENTISYGYFELLGTLSKDANGIAMMERWRMFNMLYHLTDVESYNDRVKYLVSSMDYRYESHPRIILGKALIGLSKDMRLFSTAFLRNLRNKERDTQKWVIGLLHIQLYDVDLDVCKLAVEVLEEYCEDSENLEHFIKLQPSLTHLGDTGTPLLLRFLSTSNGFRYLQNLDYVHVEIDNWFHGENEQYVKLISEYLEIANCEAMSRLQAVVHQTSTLPTEQQQGIRMAPRHFYGELTRTEEGCQLLESKGHFNVFTQTIHELKLEDKNKEAILKLKGCIWAVAHIGANPLGIPLLEECNVVKDIVEIFHCNKICSVKGTAFFALGLIASTHEGAEILDEFGWTTVRTPFGKPLGICVPSVLEDALFIEKSNEILQDELETKTQEDEEEETEFPKVHTDPVKRKIITALCDLSNQVLANDASKTLVKIEIKHPNVFHSVDLYLEAMELMEKYRYKQPVRRFIFELFDSNSLLDKMAKRQKEHQRRARTSGDSTKLVVTAV